jgi:hypothetical protein
MVFAESVIAIAGDAKTDVGCGDPDGGMVAGLNEGKGATDPWRGRGNGEGEGKPDAGESVEIGACNGERL